MNEYEFVKLGEYVIIGVAVIFISIIIVGSSFFGWDPGPQDFGC